MMPKNIERLILLSEKEGKLQRKEFTSYEIFGPRGRAETLTKEQRASAWRAFFVLLHRLNPGRFKVIRPQMEPTHLVVWISPN